MVCDPTNHYPSAGPDGGVDMPFITDINHHEVTDEVEKFMLNWGCSLEVTPPATTIAHTDSDAWLDINSIWNSEVGRWECYQDDFEETGHFPTLAVCQYGNGRVVAIGDKGWLVNGWLDNYDHYELAINIFDWLSFNLLTFISAYYSPEFSPEFRALDIRFSELISDAPGLQPDLNKIKVHDAGSDPVDLGSDAQYEVLGDTLKITNLSDDAHNAIADVGNPQIDIDTAAVYDLAGNPINAFYNRPITIEIDGPDLSSTGNTYEHIWNPDKMPPNQGLLILTFDEIVDVSTITELAKIKLAAGTSSVDLGGAEVLTETDVITIEIKITDDDTVSEIVSWQDVYDTLYVGLEAGAVKNLVGNENIEQYQALEEWIQKDITPPSPVTDFTAYNPTNTTIDLTWTNPPDEDFAGALIVRSQDSITWSPTGGVSYSIDQVVAEGVIVRYLDADDHSTKPFTDTALLPSTTYYYRAFAYDISYNYSIGVETSDTTLLIYGDVSWDGNVTAYDAALVLQYVVGLKNLSSVERQVADVTNDGNITALDAALILQHSVGLITQFPAELKTVAAPALSAKSYEDALIEEIARLEATHLNSEQQKVLEQLKSLISKRLLPKHTVLLQNYPHPFNPDTWLPYELAKDATVTIRIYDVKGQLVRQLDLGSQKAGSYIEREKAAYWDGRDGLGQAVSSGIYFYTLKAGDFQATEKMVIVK